MFHLLKFTIMAQFTYYPVAPLCRVIKKHNFNYQILQNTKGKFYLYVYYRSNDGFCTPIAFSRPFTARFRYSQLKKLLPYVSR